MWIPYLVNEDIGMHPEIMSWAWEKNLMNGCVFQIRIMEDSLIGVHQNQLHGSKHLLLNCDTSFYDLFMSELVTLFRQYDRRNGQL
jgi:hypothetical protein